jgi:hypothetical protein
VIDVGAKFVWEDCGCVLIVRVMEHGREKWRFGLDDKNIHTVVRDCDRKIKTLVTPSPSAPPTTPGVISSHQQMPPV